MARALTLAAILAGITLSFGAPARAASDRIALVIGNGAYQHAATLANPANDAPDIAQVLRGIGFEVVEGSDLGKRAMEEKIREFGRKLDGAEVALFFYAGHGMQVGGSNYLVPVDARLERPATCRSRQSTSARCWPRWKPSSASISSSSTRAATIRSPSFARLLGARSTAVGQGLATIQSAVGTMIAYATQPDATALDGTGRNSPFTTALLKHIARAGSKSDHDEARARRRRPRPTTSSCPGITPR